MVYNDIILVRCNLSCLLKSTYVSSHIGCKNPSIDCIWEYREYLYPLPPGVWAAKRGSERKLRLFNVNAHNEGQQ